VAAFLSEINTSHQTHTRAHTHTHTHKEIGGGGAGGGIKNTILISRVTLPYKPVATEGKGIRWYPNASPFKR